MNTTSITCPRCGRTSYHPKDVEEGYCAACHDWTSAQDPWRDELERIILRDRRRREP